MKYIRILLVHLMNGMFKFLLVQGSFVQLEKSQSTPGAEGARVTSLKMPQRLNPVFGNKLGVPF